MMEQKMTVLIVLRTAGAGELPILDNLNFNPQPIPYHAHIVDRSDLFCSINHGTFLSVVRL